MKRKFKKSLSNIAEKFFAPFIHSKKSELVGLVFIISSSFFQFFLFQPTESLANDSKMYRLEEKVDIIFMLITSHHKGYGINSTDRSNISSYQFAGEDSSLKTVEDQTATSKFLTAILFIVGTILIMHSKALSIREERGEYPLRLVVILTSLIFFIGFSFFVLKSVV